jgi:ribosomal subunit interface protein
MQIQITGEGIEITDHIRELIENKLVIPLERHLKNFSDDMLMAAIKIKRHENQFYSVNFNMKLPGKEHLFADNTHKDLTVVVTGLREEVERQIEKYKTKLRQYDTPHETNESY